MLASVVTCLTIGYPIEPALAARTADDVMKDLPLSDSQKQDVLNGEVVKQMRQRTDWGDLLPPKDLFHELQQPLTGQEIQIFNKPDF
jgi:hypothetical protein